MNSGATITNCAYLDTVAPQAAADGTTSGMTAHTADYMRSAEFAVDMGMNQDDGTLNGGFPVLPWQGGSMDTLYHRYIKELQSLNLQDWRRGRQVCLERLNCSLFVKFTNFTCNTA